MLYSITTEPMNAALINSAMPNCLEKKALSNQNDPYIDPFYSNYIKSIGRKQIVVKFYDIYRNEMCCVSL